MDRSREDQRLKDLQVERVILFAVWGGVHFSFPMWQKKSIPFGFQARGLQCLLVIPSRQAMFFPMLFQGLGVKFKLPGGCLEYPRPFFISISRVPPSSLFLYTCPEFLKVLITGRPPSTPYQLPQQALIQGGSEEVTPVHFIDFFHGIG